jgi:hypothetical protein
LLAVIDFGLTETSVQAVLLRASKSITRSNLKPLSRPEDPTDDLNANRNVQMVPVSLPRELATSISNSAN